MPRPATTFILSDLHLAPPAEEDGVWHRYLTEAFFPDDRAAALFEEIAAQGPAAELILAGDTFDFDLVRGRAADPWGGPLARWTGAARTAGAAVRRLDAILDRHPVFERALARVLAAGVRVVILAGNHDAELAWPEVHERLQARLARARAEAGPGGGAGAPRPAFEPWFVHRPGLFFVEHGHQHDPFSRPVDVRSGLDARRAAARLPFASICQRALTNHLGSFNSTVEASYILGVRGYVAHWWRYHALSGRSLFFTWLFGAKLALLNVVRQEWREPGAPPPEALEAYAAARGLPPGAGAALARLQPAAAIRDPVAVLRELWLDRVAALALAGALAALLALAGVPGPLALGIGAAALVALLAGLALRHGGSSVAAYAADLPAAAERIAAAARVPFVVHGHTHGALVVPFRADGAAASGGGAYLNAGAWSAGFLDPECTRPAHERFTFVEIDGRRAEARLCRQDAAGRTVIATAAAPPAPATPDRAAHPRGPAPRLPVEADL